MRAGSAVTASKDKFPQRERQAGLFNGAGNTLGESSSSSKSKPGTGEVYEVVSSGDEEGTDAGHTQRSRDKPTKKQSRSVPSPQPLMASGRPLRGGTKINPGESFKELAAKEVVSHSTRSSTNNGQISRTAYSRPAKSALPTSALQHGLDNNFSGDKPGPSSASSRVGKAQQNSLPSFARMSNGFPPQASTSQAPWNQPQYNNAATTASSSASRAPMSRDTRSQPQHQAYNTGSSLREYSEISATTRLNAGKSIDFKKNRKDDESGGNKRIHSQPTIQVALGASSHRQPNTASIAATSSINENLHFLPKTLTSTPKGKAAVRPTVKSKGMSDVISIDDDGSEADTIENSEDDGRRHLVARAKNGSMGQTKGIIPNGNTTEKRKAFEGRTNGTIVHERPPPPREQPSPEDDSLLIPKTRTNERAKAKPSVVASMTSRTGADPPFIKKLGQASSHPAKPTRPTPGHIPIGIGRLASGKGTLKAPKESSLTLVVAEEPQHSFIFFKVSDDTRHALRDTIIQLPRISEVVFGVLDDAACAFVQIRIEEAADDDEEAAVLLPYYMFEFQALATNQTKTTFSKAFADLINALRYLSKSCDYEIVSRPHSSLNDLMRQTNELLKGHREDRRESDRISGRTKSLRSREKGKTDAIAHLMNPSSKKQFNHDLDDRSDEEKAHEVTVSSKPSRPRARPSAGHPGAFNAPGMKDSLALPGADPPKAKATRIEPGDYGATPVENFFSGAKSTASTSNAAGCRTRSTNQERGKAQAPAESDSDVELESVAAKPWSGRLANEHEIAFVFPREATGAITVENRDINRLAPGEFLNDTLIEYGMMRIYDDLSRKDPRLVDQVHMFSSFFYKKLSTRDRQTKIDPYQTVRKWTNKVNIFEKRYIFIPINEHFHWYLAIIVNPGRMLLPPPPTQPKTNVPKRKTRASQEGSNDTSKKAEIVTTSRFFGKEGRPVKDAGEGTASSLHRNTGNADMLDSKSLSSPELPATDRSASPSPALLDMEVDKTGDNDLSRTSSARSDASSPAPLVTSQSASAKKGTRSTASATAPVPSEQSRNKMDIDANMQELTLGTFSVAEDERCYIITLDSLGGSHPQVVKNLKAYLESEAKDKGKLALDATVPTKEIDGIYKQISANVPQQPNMSDCGLYVLHFSDMFLRRQTEIMDALVKQKRQQSSSSEVNRLWQYEDAEKKRESFYDELIAEAKDYKQWRAAKSALGESEGDKADGAQSSDDDGVDVEVVTSSKSKTPEQLVKRKTKPRTIPQSEPSESESDAPQVTSKRGASSSLRPGPRFDREPSDTDTSNKAVRNSPTPKLSLDAGRPSPIDRQHSPAAARDSAHMGSPDGIELMADIESLIRQAPQPHSASLNSPHMHTSAPPHAEEAAMSNISGELASTSEQSAAASLKTSTSTSASASTSSSDGESSGSEDSQDELTDASGAGKSRQSASRSRKPNRGVPPQASPPKVADRASDETTDHQPAFRYTMVKPYVGSQPAPATGQLVASGSNSDIEADISQYQLQGTAGASGAHPGTPDASTSMALDTPVENTVKAKRPRSEDLEPAHRSPGSKESVGPKRQKPASIAAPDEAFAHAERVLPQAGDQGPDVWQTAPPDEDAKSSSKRQIRSAPVARLWPAELPEEAESQGTHAGDVTVISDDEDNEPTSGKQLLTPSKGPVPTVLQNIASSRPSKSTSSPNTHRESLGRPPRPLNINPSPA